MTRRASGLVLLWLGVSPANAELPPDAQAATLLPDVPGWTAEPADCSCKDGNAVVLRRFVQGDKWCVVVLFMGPLADGVTSMMTSMPADRFVPPLPADRWTERGYRLWASERDGSLYEMGLVLNDGGAAGAAHSAYVSESGEGLTRADGVAFLHALDWDRIRDLAVR